ncbi:hypothetical protein K7432_005867 [Basidiobolus ranarum]|uniref:Uncharacterized protein n=1 Tax=Basidiobolus ranarum TaxID=34480 RepID=A0ABR2WVX2_9FUNG
MRLVFNITLGIFAVAVISAYPQAQDELESLRADEEHPYPGDWFSSTTTDEPLEAIDDTASTLNTTASHILARRNSNSDPAIAGIIIYCKTGTWGCDNESVPSRSYFCMMNKPQYSACTMDQICGEKARGIYGCIKKPPCIDNSMACTAHNVSPDYTACVNGQSVKQVCQAGVCIQDGTKIKCEPRKTTKKDTPTYSVKTGAFITRFGQPVTKTLSETVETVAVVETYDYTAVYETAVTYEAIETWEAIETEELVMTNVYTNVVLNTDIPTPTESTETRKSIVTESYNATHLHTGQHITTKQEVQLAYLILLAHTQQLSRPLKKLLYTNLPRLTSLLTYINTPNLTSRLILISQLTLIKTPESAIC